MSVYGFPAGTAWHQPITCQDSSGSAINLTGATAMHCIVFKRPATQHFDLTVGAGITVVSATLGQIKVSLTAVQSTAKAGEYAFEIYATLASGDVVLLNNGELHIAETYLGA